MKSPRPSRYGVLNLSDRAARRVRSEWETVESPVASEFGRGVILFRAPAETERGERLALFQVGANSGLASATRLVVEASRF